MRVVESAVRCGLSAILDQEGVTGARTLPGALTRGSPIREDIGRQGIRRRRILASAE